MIYVLDYEGFFISFFIIFKECLFGVWIDKSFTINICSKYMDTIWDILIISISADASFLMMNTAHSHMHGFTLVSDVNYHER